MSTTASRSRFDKKLAALQASGFNPSPQQEDIFLEVALGEDNLFVEAVAGCLASDTVIEVNRAGKSYKTTIDKLVHMLNGGVSSGRTFDPDIETRVRAYDEKGGVIRLMTVASGIQSGVKEVWRLKTETKTIKATADHRFLTTRGWKRLSELTLRDSLIVDGGKTKPEGRKAKKHYDRITGMDAHPYCHSSKPHLCCWKHRLVVEAALNDLTYDALVRRIRDAKLSGVNLKRELKFLDPAKWHIHHIDGNHKNNRLDNLEVMTSTAHLSHHAQDGGWKNVQAWTVAEKVISKELIGEEMTYDLTMEDESNPNFIANGIVTHNSGKTTTILKSLAFCPMANRDGVLRTPEILYLVFSKKMADEIKARPNLPSNLTTCTTHSFGFRALRDSMASMKYKVDEYAVHNFVKARVGNTMTYDGYKRLSTAIASIVSFMKNQGWEKAVMPYVEDLLLDYAYENNIDPEFLLPHAHLVIDVLANRGPQIDFDDMLYIPTVDDTVVLPKYDWVFIDECVPSWTPVMMADGSSKQIVDVEIGDMVRSYDTETGKAKNCRVTATQKIVNNKPLVKVKVRHNHKTGTNYKTNQLVCTIDHKVWTTNRGWVQAGRLRIGDDVIIETAAKTTQKGKISKKGRDHLSTIHIGNKKGNGDNGGQSAKEFNAIKGGNGRGLTVAQQVLCDALGPGWETEYVIKTGNAPQHGKGGLPTHYKIDLAYPAKKIAIEIDGASHRQSQNVDVKKEDFLTSEGWTIFRYTNREVAKQLADIAHTHCMDSVNCPRPATVVSIEETYITEHHVYDITVEDCHNFYANGVLVHNCQDMNPCQIMFLEKMRRQHPRTRFVMVGDPNQSIFAFRGADANAVEQLINSFDCKQLPLSYSYRCSVAAIQEAQKFVPTIQHAPGAAEGLVDLLYANEFDDMVAPGDMILCRVNAPLIRKCLEMIKQGKAAKVLGRDIGRSLFNLYKGAVKLHFDGDNYKALHEAFAQAAAKLIRPGDEMKLEALHDRYEALEVLIPSATATEEEIRRNIDSIFSDDKPVYTLSSIHKAKGLEANKVYLLRADLLPFPKAKDPIDLQQERNLQYVAVTRAMDSFYYVLESNAPENLDEPEDDGDKDMPFTLGGFAGDYYDSDN